MSRWLVIHWMLAWNNRIQRTAGPLKPSQIAAVVKILKGSP